MLRFSFMPGLGYWKSATSVPPAATITGYDRGQLEVLAAGLQLAHVVTPLEVSDPMVEAQLLHGPDADVVMLANWSGQPIPQLRVTIHGAAHAANVSASQGATLDVVHSGDDLLVTVPIDDVEAVVLRR